MDHLVERVINHRRRDLCVMWESDSELIHTRSGVNDKTAEVSAQRVPFAQKADGMPWKTVSYCPGEHIACHASPIGLSAPPLPSRNFKVPI